MVSIDFPTVPLGYRFTSLRISSIVLLLVNYFGKDLRVACVHLQKQLKIRERNGCNDAGGQKNRGISLSANTP